jgi:phosphatidate cytidylyltransferase
MEQALKNRLKFGSMMLLGLFGLLWLDYAVQKWTAGTPGLPYGLGGVGVVLLMMFLLPQAIEELTAMFTAEGVRPYRRVAVAGAALLLLHAFATQFEAFRPIAASTLAFIVVFVMLMAALMKAFDKQTEDAIHRMAGTVLATMYSGGLEWFLVALRVKHSTASNPHVFNGSTMIVLMILLTVKSTDIGAYFGGRALGRHKLIPWLSPGKTWEGLFFGLLTAGAVGAVCTHFISPPNYTIHWWKGVIFGGLLGGIGQLGDLLESLMKRDAEVKDSGRVVPGFGGVLDVMDSPLLAAPFAYILFSLF